MHAPRRWFFVTALAATSSAFFSTSAEGGKIYWVQSFEDRIQRANLDGTAPQILIQATYAFDPVAVAVDPSAGKLYWAETFENTIRWANLDGTGAAIIVQPSAVFAPRALAVDPPGGKLYWAQGSGLTSMIRRANLNGSASATIAFPPDSLNPVAVAVDSVAGKIYWAENPGNRIRRADLNGGNPETVVDAISVADPVSIAVDSGAAKLYWAERSGDRIRYADANGFNSNVDTFLDAVFVSDPVSIALDLVNARLYWAEGAASRIRRADLTRANVRTILEPLFLFDPLSLAVDGTPGNIVWDTDPLSADRTTRSLRFRVEAAATATGTPPQVAIQVTMVELQHPNPRNAVATVALPTQTVPQNFSKFDTASNGVCSGATATPNYNNYPCDPSKVPSNADCLCNTPSCPSNDATHNGVCIGNPGAPLVACTATGETVPPNASGQGGCARWVGKPATSLEAQQLPTWGHYRAARLQCTPFYYDWVTETAGKVCAGPLGPFNTGLPCVDNSNCTAPATCIDKKITVVGAEILPSSKYSVRTYGSSCAGSEGSCAPQNLGPPVTMLTRRHGDVAPVFTPPDVGQPGSTDVAEMLRGLNKLGPLRKAGAKISPNLPEENLDLDVGDLGRVVDSVRGYAYPASESGPCPCPPVHPVTGLPLLCGATPCACDAGPACAACGGGQCVRTCIGGENDGLACRDNDLVHNHCPGGTCGSGFCRDKCARCTPP